MPESPSTLALLSRIQQGDFAARDALATRYGKRLRRLVEMRLDRRVRARIDPSDVVQETLLVAFRRLNEYLEGKPIPFYPWLRRLAWDQLCDLDRRHRTAQRRSVARECGQLPLPHETSNYLAQQLRAGGLGPASQLVQREQTHRIEAAIAALPERERELMLLRYVEQMNTEEVAAELDITTGAVKGLHRRALIRLQAMLDDPSASNS